MSLPIKIVKLHEKAVIPTKATTGSACFDLYSTQDYLLFPGQFYSFGTGIGLEIPEDFVGLIYPRSGLAFKNQTNLINGVGVIDSDFRAEVRIGLKNLSPENTVYIEEGDRIAQIMFVPVPQVEFTVQPAFSTQTERGSGGFGSTGGIGG